MVDAEMWTSCFLISALLTAASASEFDDFDDNGWQPVSNDVVANQIRRGFTPVPRYTKADDIVTISYHKTFQNPSQVEITQDKKSQICDERGYKACGQKTTEKAELQLEYDFTPNNFQLVEDVQVHRPVRKSKMITETDAFFNKVLLPKGENIDFVNKEMNLKTDIKRDDIHTYEVTENTIIDDAVTEETNLKVKLKGYEYNSPDAPNTTGLFKYLSKYNIKEGDDLQNYALSRRAKAGSPATNNRVRMPLQFKVPIRHNSLNHLSVDPLLAVFLSNYGYYLQGQYGIENQYNNLYGYLASNNIHNNKPFGLYKLFSDTDSSN